MNQLFETLSSHELYGGLFSESTWKQMALFTKLLGSVIRSCAHDSCRWYADYRNAEDFTASESGFSCSMLFPTHVVDVFKK